MNRKRVLLAVAVAFSLSVLSPPQRAEARWGDWFLEQCCKWTGVQWCCKEHDGDDYPWPE